MSAGVDGSSGATSGGTRGGTGGTTGGSSAGVVGGRPVTYGPTVVELDLDGLDKVATLASEAGRAAVHAHGSMSASGLEPLAFGLMNAPLGAAATALAGRARSLTGQVAQTAPAFAEATRGAARAWRTIEHEAEAGLARLAAEEQE